MSTFEITQDSADTRRRVRVPDSFQTTNGVQQTAFQIPVPAGSALFVQVRVLVLKSDIGAAQSMIEEGCFRRAAAGNVVRASGNSGALKVIGRTIGDFIAVVGLYPDVDLVANAAAQTVDIKVTGQTGVTINWYFEILTIRNLV